MRTAIIADTHGNLIALEAVLAELEREGITRMVCLGDVAGLGAQPREVIARLRTLACPVVMGNADEFLLKPALLDPARHPGASDDLRRMHEMERWCAEQLSPDDLDYLRSFQPTVELPLDDAEGDEAQTLLCYHGSPRSNQEEIRAATPEVELAEKLGPRRTLVMAGGHTHEQFVRRLGQSLILNPGSVGLPYETLPDGSHRNPPWAEYAVLTAEGDRIGIELRRVPMDQAAVRQALLDSGMPHASWWAADWR